MSSKEIEKMKQHLDETRRKRQWLEKKVAKFEEILQRKGVSEEDIKKIIKRYGK